MGDSLDYLVREQERLRDMVGSLEMNIERKLKQRIETSFSQKLEAELRSRDADVTFLKTRVKMLEGEEQKRTQGNASKAAPQTEPLLGSNITPKEQAKQTLTSLKTGFKNFQFTQYVRTIAFSQLLICFMTNIARIDLFCIVILLALYACNELDRKAMISYLGFMTFSIVIDIVWMVQHADSSVFAVTTAFGSAIQFVFAVTVLAMFAKLIILYPAFSTYRSLPTVKPSEQANASSLTRSAYGHFIDVFAVIQLAFTFCNALARADLYSVVLLFVLYALHERDRTAMRGYFLFLGFSILVDLCWLGINGVNMYLAGQQGTARRAYPIEFVFITSIVNLVFKIIFSLLAIRSYKGLPEKKPSENKPDVGLEEGYGNSALNKFMKTAKTLSYARWTTGIISTQLVLCLFQSLARLDPFAVVCAIGLYAVNESDKLALEAYFGFLAASFFFDIAWLDLHKDPTKFAFMAGDAPTVAFVSACIILGIILKFAILFPAIRHHAEQPDIKPSEQGTAIGNQRAKLLAFYAKFRQLGNSEKYRRVMIGFGLIHLILFFCMSLDRIDPFCIIIPILFYSIHERDRNALLAYLLFMDFSFILDIVWLALHSDELQALADAASGSTSVQPSLVFVYACAIVSIVVKFFAHIPAILLLRTMPTKTSEDVVAGMADRGYVPESPMYPTASNDDMGQPAAENLSMGELERALQEREERLRGEDERYRSGY
mmetsp:Transcript_24468/g.42085  ORF Transcript_24468/g.42085 Transcript_24468/m.42085 type:complete len:717 (+) Transcript_24468:118-2268(+)